MNCVSNLNIIEYELSSDEQKETNCSRTLYVILKIYF